jgi:hypothetical protein
MGHLIMTQCSAHSHASNFRYILNVHNQINGNILHNVVIMIWIDVKENIMIIKKFNLFVNVRIRMELLRISSRKAGIVILLIISTQAIAYDERLL